MLWYQNVQLGHAVNSIGPGCPDGYGGSRSSQRLQLQDQHVAKAHTESAKTNSHGVHDVIN